MGLGIGLQMFPRQMKRMEIGLEGAAAGGGGGGMAVGVIGCGVV